MRNRRRTNTKARRQGTETGSVTHTVTFYPARDEQDKYIVDNLNLLKGIGSGASGWIRQACIDKAFGVSNSPPEVKVKSKPQVVAPPSEGVSDKVADSMGLKFGRKKE